MHEEWLWHCHSIGIQSVTTGQCSHSSIEGLQLLISADHSVSCFLSTPTVTSFRLRSLLVQSQPTKSKWQLWFTMLKHLKNGSSKAKKAFLWIVHKSIQHRNISQNKSSPKCKSILYLRFRKFIFLARLRVLRLAYKIALTAGWRHFHRTKGSKLKHFNLTVLYKMESVLVD